MNLKIIVTTSDKHLHLLKIFCYLFNKYWDSNRQVEVVGYKQPDFELPSNFTFVSLGTQDFDYKGNFTRDLRQYFAKQDKFFIWFMEDSFIKEKVNQLILKDVLEKFTTFYNAENRFGRINLTDEGVKQDHQKWGLCYETIQVYENTQTSKYRLSTQPSIWNRDFLLKYMKEDLNPWDFETQDPKNDGFTILGLDKFYAPVIHNEGVRRFDLFKYNLDGFEESTLKELKELKLI